MAGQIFVELASLNEATVASARLTKVLDSNALDSMHNPNWDARGGKIKSWYDIIL
jgi:hypothetical protein